MANQEFPEEVSSKARFIEALENIENSESYIAIISHLEKYLDPEEKRSFRLRSMVRELRASIRSFHNDAQHLLLLIIRLDQALALAGIKAVTAALTRPVPSSVLESGSAQDHIDELRGCIEAAQRSLAELDWQATMAEAYSVGLELLEVRSKALDEFASKQLGITIEDYSDAALKLARENLKERVQEAFDKLVEFAESEEIQEYLSEEVAAVVPFAGHAYRAGKLAKKLRDKAREIAEPYVPKGPIDALFDFMDTIEDTNEFAENQIAILNEQAAMIEASTRQ